MALRFAILCALLALALPACVYRHTTEPLDVNFDATEVRAWHRGGSVKRFRYALVDVQWSSNAIAEFAQNRGIQTVFYADLETLRIMGVWTQQWVLVYGE